MFFKVFHETSVSLFKTNVIIVPLVRIAAVANGLKTTKCANYEPHSRKKMVKITWQIYNKSTTTVKMLIFHFHIPSALILTCLIGQGIKRRTSCPHCRPLCVQEDDKGAEGCIHSSSDNLQCIYHKITKFSTFSLVLREAVIK